MNNGSGPLTVNNKGQQVLNSVAYPLPSISAGYDKDSGEGTQNVDAGRDQDANHGGGAFMTDNDNRNVRGSSATAQAPMDEMEQREPAHLPSPTVQVMAYPMLGHQAASFSAPRISSGKKMRSEICLPIKKNMKLSWDLTAMMPRVSWTIGNSSRLFPQCLWIGGVEGVSEYPVEYGGFADIWTGSVGGVRVALKVVWYRFHSQEKHEPMIKVR
ncbi:hypothetical protein PM082_013308 [Marasmius tenuissimus]|nr:hypothetical protein PM082_013308 [Marasmius tenuissimus]